MSRISKSHLFDAKAFLCWQAFDDLSVQLVPIRATVAYHYPPQNNRHSIILFYPEFQQDYSEPLFLLFHEAGHILQWKQLEKSGRIETGKRIMNLSKGRERVLFEEQAWTLGRELFMRFLDQDNLPRDELLKGYAEYQKSCVNSYKDE